MGHITERSTKGFAAKNIKLYKVGHQVVMLFSFLCIFNLATFTLAPKAHAAFGVVDALKTVGIAAGIGTVLGVSTLPFYDSPFSHLSNVYIGAGAGALVGIGLAAYMFSTNSEQDDELVDELIPKKKKPEGKGQKQDQTTPEKAPQKEGRFQENGQRHLVSVPARLMQERLYAAQSWVPKAGSGHPKGWMFAVRVLELRF